MRLVSLLEAVDAERALVLAGQLNTGQSEIVVWVLVARYLQHYFPLLDKLF